MWALQYSQALITANHVSVVMQIVTNATRDGVIFRFTLGCCLGLLAPTLLLVGAGVTQATVVILNQRSHGTHAGLLDAVQVGLNSTGQNTGANGFTRSSIGPGLTGDGGQQTGWTGLGRPIICGRGHGTLLHSISGWRKFGHKPPQVG